MMLDEIQKRQEMLKSEMKLRKASRFEDEEDETRRCSFGSVEASDDSLCDHKCGGIIQFTNNALREIQRGSCICILANLFVRFSLDEIFNLRSFGEKLHGLQWN